MNLGIHSRTDLAPEQTVGRLAQAVDQFRRYYDKLTSVKYGAAIARTKNVELYRAFGNELAKAEKTKGRIEAVTGAWENIKEWSGLGALPLIPIAVALGLIAVIAAATSSIQGFMRAADIRIAMQRDPDLTYERARNQVDKEQQSSFGKALDVAQLGFYALLAFIGYKLFARR